LDPAAFDRLTEIARSVNQVLTDRAAACGLAHLDGKAEFVYHDGDIVLADVAGTMDENRFSLDGTQLSKELVRQWYRENDPGWYEQVTGAKERATAEGTADWKQFVDREPKPLDPAVRELVEHMYMAAANRWLDRDVFDAPDLDSVVQEVTER
ncbi:MAG: phosphoribosylaminoimidazolesuccinocarboxamide synthase, partial [Candidatus Nanohaloarchaea archaeon]